MAMGTKKTAADNSSAVNEIEQQIEQIRSDIASLANTIGEMGSEQASKAKKRLSEQGDVVLDSSRKALEAANRRVEKLEDRLAEEVRQKPIQTLGIAAGIGFLAALLFRR